MDGESKSGQAPPTSTLPPLPPCWQKIHSDNGHYYWNKETNKTQWKFPAEEAEEYRLKKESHGYVNVPEGEGEVLPVVYDSVHGDDCRVSPMCEGGLDSTDMAAPSCDNLGHLVPSSEPPLYDEIDITKLNRTKAVMVLTNGHGRTTASQGMSANTPRSPTTARPELDSPTPPALPARLYIEEDVDDDDNSSPPPPIPARNYLDEDVLAGGEPIVHLPTSVETSPPLPSQPLSPSNDGETPPPIPARTSFSELLLPPTSVDQLLPTTEDQLLPATVDQLPQVGVSTTPADSTSEAGRPEDGRYVIAEDGTRHFVLYDDGMAYAETTVSEPKKQNSVSELVSRPLPPPPTSTSESSSQESPAVSPVKAFQRASPSALSDGIQALDSVSGHEYHSLEEAKPNHSVSPLPLRETLEASRQPDSMDLTPPSPQNPFARRLVPAYEVVPVGAKVAANQVDESGYMEVDSNLQRKIKVKHASLRHENLQKSLPEQPPELPARGARRSPSLKEKKLSTTQTKTSPRNSPLPKKSGSKTLGFWSRRKNGDDALSAKQETQAGSSDNEYDKLQHQTALLRLSATLPKNLDESAGYSQLNLSKEAVLLRSGVTLRRTIVSVADSIDLKLDDDDLNAPVPLIHAPNAPTANIQRRPHMYEKCDLDELNGQKNGESKRDPDAPSLAWDNSDMPPVAQPTNQVASTSSNGSPTTKPSWSKSSPPLLQRPKGISDEDYERRLQRLQYHDYPELDILEWPTSGEEKSPPTRRASELKAVVRESWLSAVSSQDGLPPGWKQEVNEQGQVFYWHIPTGNIQYVRPEGNSAVKTKSQSPPCAGDTDSSHASPGRSKPRATTFAAKYIGSLTIPEGVLVKGRSVHVVHKSINALVESEACEGVEEIGFRKDDSMYLQIKGMELRWLDPETSMVRMVQPINRIRVWGIGQENERDFGYVSRNPITNQHQCHVFRCDIAARGVARALLDNHKHSKAIVSQATPPESPAARKPGQPAGSSRESSSPLLASADGAGTVLVSVPLTADERLRSVSCLSDTKTNSNSVDSACAEKYTRMDVLYIGCTETKGPHGINHVNEAVTKLMANKSRWMEVHVDVASSHIKIIDRKTEQVLKEHRVRFLSFLGIAKDDRYCGYIVDSGDNQFHFYGFHCTPNTDRLCLALHSACQARYQRVLDAHMDGDMKDSDMPMPNAKTKSQSLLNRLGSLKKRKEPEEAELLKPSSKSYVVHFLGMEQVPKSEGVDAVRGPIRRLTEVRKGLHLVELTVASSGFTITDPHKQFFSKKHIPTKKVTYCVRIKNHLAFIAKEGSKFMCYAFTESEVDAGTIVAAVQNILA